MATFVKPYLDATADETVVNIKATEGDIYFLEATNANATDIYVQFFDAAAANVTLGTTVPDFVLFVPAGDGTNDGAIIQNFYNSPVHFENAITYAVTTTATGSTGPTSDGILQVLYR